MRSATASPDWLRRGFDQRAVGEPDFIGQLHGILRGRPPPGPRRASTSEAQPRGGDDLGGAGGRDRDRRDHHRLCRHASVALIGFGDGARRSAASPPCALEIGAHRAIRFASWAWTAARSRAIAASSRSRPRWKIGESSLRLLESRLHDDVSMKPEPWVRRPEGPGGERETGRRRHGSSRREPAPWPARQRPAPGSRPKRQSSSGQGCRRRRPAAPASASAAVQRRRQRGDETAAAAFSPAPPQQLPPRFQPCLVAGGEQLAQPEQLAVEYAGAGCARPSRYPERIAAATSRAESRPVLSATSALAASRDQIERPGAAPPRHNRQPQTSRPRDRATARNCRYGHRRRRRSRARSARGKSPARFPPSASRSRAEYEAVARHVLMLLPEVRCERIAAACAAIPHRRRPKP